jgi:hypothetical protein
MLNCFSLVNTKYSDRFYLPCYKDKDDKVIICLSCESTKKATMLFSCSKSIFTKIVTNNKDECNIKVFYDKFLRLDINDE